MATREILGRKQSLMSEKDGESDRRKRREGAWVMESLEQASAGREEGEWGSRREDCREEWER